MILFAVLAGAYDALHGGMSAIMLLVLFYLLAQFCQEQPR